MSEATPDSLRADSRGTLIRGEVHPAAYDAMAWIRGLSPADLAMWAESFASCAIDGNRIGDVCGETLQRLMARQPVSDRYLLGLAWIMRDWGSEKVE